MFFFLNFCMLCIFHAFLSGHYSAIGSGQIADPGILSLIQSLHRLEKYLNIQDCLEKSLKIKFALKST